MKGTLTMSIEFFGISVGCTDAAAVARFWGAVLGRQVADGASSEDAVLLVEPEALSGPGLAFHRVPETKVEKNRLHLDLISDSFDPESDRLLSLGAKSRPATPGGRPLSTSKTTSSI
jgi:hypothetical protein